MNEEDIKIFTHENCVISLGLGDMFTIDSGGPTDEGYSYTATEFKRCSDTGVITCAVSVRARDCDGAADYYSDYVVMIDITGKPNFKRVSESQRDHSAEAMGY